MSFAGRQVSVYDTIDKEGGYSGKVRLLGEFHPSMATNIEPGGQDIDDPLYGNVGGAEEKVLPMRRPPPDCSLVQDLVQAVHALTWLASQYTSLLAVNLLRSKLHAVSELRACQTYCMQAAVAAALRTHHGVV